MKYLWITVLVLAVGLGAAMWTLYNPAKQKEAAAKKLETTNEISCQTTCQQKYDSLKASQQKSFGMDACVSICAQEMKTKKAL